MFPQFPQTDHLAQHAGPLQQSVAGAGLAAGSDPPAEKLRQVTHAVQSDQLEKRSTFL